VSASVITPPQRRRRPSFIRLYVLPPPFARFAVPEGAARLDDVAVLVAVHTALGYERGAVPV